MTLHTNSHWILFEAGKPVPPQKKVRDWWDGIDCTEMMARKVVLKSDPKMLDDFIMTSDYLASFVKKKVFNRHILSSMYGNCGRSRGGRGHNRHGSWYRSGRGYVCGCGHGTRGNPIEVIELEAQNYSNNEWTQLMDEQKDKVNKLRKVVRDNKHKMASATSHNRDDEDNNQAGNAMNYKKRSGKQDRVGTA
eukprot:4682148-Ditylum_brightwellii.AAC.1